MFESSWYCFEIDLYMFTWCAAKDNLSPLKIVKKQHTRQKKQTLPLSCIFLEINFLEKNGIFPLFLGLSTTDRAQKFFTSTVVKLGCLFFFSYDMAPMKLSSLHNIRIVEKNTFFDRTHRPAASWQLSHLKKFLNNTHTHIYCLNTFKKQELSHLNLRPCPADDRTFSTLLLLNHRNDTFWGTIWSKFSQKKLQLRKT